MRNIENFVTYRYVTCFGLLRIEKRRNPYKQGTVTVLRIEARKRGSAQEAQELRRRRALLIRMDAWLRWALRVRL